MTDDEVISIVNQAVQSAVQDAVQSAVLEFLPAEYTVSDNTGNITDRGGTIAGTAADPFRFFVRNPDYFRSTRPPPDTDPALMVQMSMPLGGTESGLFRFPRVGEQVLVVKGGSSRYLIGYIPTYSNNDNQDFQTAGMFQDDGRGEVFRYQQTGKVEAPEGEAYSEIGFYHRQTSWLASDEDKENYADNKNPSADPSYTYPKIDHITIHSTGDIHESAVNYHQISAKRFDIRADVKAADYQTMKQDDADFLRKGDMSIQAGKRIIINGGEEIQLRVGRSSIVITDEKIQIRSKKTHNASSSNSWDSFIDVDPMNGINMFGQHLDFSAAYGFQLQETYGGAISSASGMLNISGRDVKLEGCNTVLYFIKGGLAFTDFVTNCTSINTARNNWEEHTAIPYANSICSSVGDGISRGWGGYQDWGDDVTWIDLLKTLHELLLKINALVFTILSAGCESPEKRDSLCFAGVISEYFLVLGAYVPLCIAGGMGGLINNAEINLAPSASIIMEAESTTDLSAIAHTEASAPLLGAVKAQSMAPKIGNLGMSIGGSLVDIVSGILEEALSGDEAVAEELTRL